MLAGKGVRIIVVMWIMTMMSFVLIPMRFYTRVFVLKAFGRDDHTFILGWVFLLLYTVFATIAAMHGLGQPMASLSLGETAKAVYMEMIGQTFAVLGMAIAKLSLGLLLLRLVEKQWHRLSIWAAMISLSIISMITAVILWVRRVPSRSIYDSRVTGHSIVSVTPFSVWLGVWCTLVDFYFAILPWLFVWKLNMKQKKRLIIAISLSLGAMFVVNTLVHWYQSMPMRRRAGICGIIRTVELGGLSSANYTEDTVNLIIWSTVELAVTLFCIGLPILRPLYRRDRSNIQPSNSKYMRQGDVESSQVSLTNFHGHVQEGPTDAMAGDKDIASEPYDFSGTHAHDDEEEAKAQDNQNRQTGKIYVQHGFRIDRN